LATIEHLRARTGRVRTAAARQRPVPLPACACKR
jgi:hypothetical protein